MEMSCGILSFVGVALVAQWFIILFYCRFKFKTRYTLATIVTFLTMFVYIHLAFNCFNLFGVSKLERSSIAPGDYDARVRSINEDFHRELLHTFNVRSDTGEDELNQPGLPGDVTYGANQNSEKGNYGYQYSKGNNADKTENYYTKAVTEAQEYGNENDQGNIEDFQDGDQTFNGHHDQGERGNLATNRRMEEIKNNDGHAEEVQWNAQWNGHIPSVHAALNGLQQDVDNLNANINGDGGQNGNNNNQAEESDEESYNTEKEAIKNLASNIYNDMSECVVTMNDYESIVQQISWRTKQQDEYITKLDKNKLKEKWDQVKSTTPWTPKQALDMFASVMPWWEQQEILYYDKIWTIGLGSEKIQLNDNRTLNYGFDFEPNKHDNGEYIANVGDHVAYRYKIYEFLGSGSYGVVVRAWDYVTRQLVAIKFMVNEKDWWDGSIVREMKMMLKIENDAPRKNFFPRVLDHFMFRNHKCVVMELLGESMYRHHRNDEPIRDMRLLRRYASDILNAMADLESMHIIHGDLKPDNMMYLHGKNNKSEGQLLKVADFGLGCVKDSEEFVCKKNHLQTRYYRCPEVMFSLPYDTPCDMFSVGIILAEFYLGKPPFWGETNTDQVAAMMEVLGLVPPHMIEESPWQHVYRHAICYVTENGFKRKPYRKPLAKVLDGMPNDLYNLITKCLTYEPEERIKASEALMHPFMLNN